jgi:segregation and condensation protein B
MRTLSERGWIRVVGHRDVPGRPAVYATTRGFLDDFGLKTLDALPPMHALLAEDEKTVQDAPPETAPPLESDAENHAETALTQPLSFADLEARLAARAERPRDDGERTDENDARSDDHESN